MSKQPIQWHEQCLASAQRYLNETELELAVHQERLQRLRDDTAFAAYQLAEAKRRGLDGFDPDRFCRKRKGPD